MQCRARAARWRLLTGPGPDGFWGQWRHAAGQCDRDRCKASSGSGDNAALAAGLGLASFRTGTTVVGHSRPAALSDYQRTADARPDRPAAVCGAGDASTDRDIGRYRD